MTRRVGTAIEEQMSAAQGSFHVRLKELASGVRQLNSRLRRAYARLVNEPRECAYADKPAVSDGCMDAVLTELESSLAAAISEMESIETMI